MTRRPVWCAPLVCLALAIVWASCAAWCQEEVRWEPTIGFEGVYKQGAWTPVFVDVSNSGDSRSGDIRLPVYEDFYDGRRTTTYTVPVELPRNSRKRYTLYAPPQEVESIYLRLGRTTEERKLKIERYAGPEDTLVVVIGGDSGLLRFLSGVSAAPRSEQRFEDYYGRHGPSADGSVIDVGHASWEGLPESWLGWEGVDAVVLGDAGFAAASPEAVAALLQWLDLGGTLIVPGGTLTPQMAASPVGGLLPVEISGTRTTPGLDLLGKWVDQSIQPQPSLVAQGRLRPEATVLCGTPEAPLISLSPAGAGRVAMASFDYTAAPVKYWDGQTAMWQRLLAQAPVPPSVALGAEQSRMPYENLLTLGEAASYTPSAALPPFWLLLGFLGAYIIVLVPVNYGLLRRFDRRELAWVTTPLVVVVFTLGAWGVGYGMRGGKIVLNRLGIVEAAPGADLARGRGYIGLFSPGRSSYTLKLEGSAAGARDLTPGHERTRRGITVQESSEPAVTDIAMNMWTSRSFAVEFLADLQGGIDGAIEWDGRDLRATVENNTGYRLRDCRLVRDNLVGQKKDVKSGASVTWSNGRASSVGDRWSRGADIRDADVKEGMARMTQRALFGDWRPGTPGATHPPQLLAIIDDPLVPVTLDRRRPETNDLTFVIADLPLHLAAGARVPVPNWMIARRVVATEGYFSGSTVSDPMVTIAEGSATYEFVLPLGEGGGEAAALSLGAPYELQPNQGGMPQPGGARRGVVSAGGPSASPGSGGIGPPLLARAYNFRLDRWETLSGASPNVIFPSPESYVSPDGRVLVQLEVPSGSVRLQGLTMSAEVNAF